MTTTKTNENQIYAIVSGLPGTWAQVSEITVDVPTTKIADGGAPEETSYGRPSYGDLTLGRPNDLARDPAVMKDARAKALAGWETTITVVTANRQGLVVSTETVQGGLKTVTGPRGDAASSNPSSVGLVFSVDNVT